MTPEEIPQELVDLLDERVGKKHRREGVALATLAEIITKYDELIGRACADGAKNENIL